ncbi:partitioning defective 3 homolog isoform X4 [Aricia agestis]|uniref:partitioning defective 3 homolog isoform X4 n=1 Tax=Aricia agestis TaxID=91739 RepID=UPI001C204C42|nr:partitioning defective 3 homolog isoform X4 [Aricia agestis]
MKDTPRCEDVADKLVRLFGWRQTYPVQKLQRGIQEKYTETGPETWIGVRALRASGGGILDPDDRVCDVADDRETLTAECSNQPQPRAAQADGASGSSAGTASPDMFRGGGGVGTVADSCVEVGAGADGGGGLQVRRGSEPTLHQDNLPLTLHDDASEQTKRWSAAVVCREDRAPHKPDARPDPAPAPHFQRHSNRLSMQFSGPGSGVWLDAAERVQSYGSKSLPRDARREPLGQDTPPSVDQNHRVEEMLRWVSGVNNVASVHPVQERPLDLLPEGGNSERAVSGVEIPVSPSSKPATQTVSVTLVKGDKGLGFTITTRDNPTGGHCPIYIKNILPKGAAVTDGRLRAGDRLVSVGGAAVAGLAQQQVVALLRNTPPRAAVDIVVERPAPHPALATHPQNATRTQRVEPQPSPKKYNEKAIGSEMPVQTENKTENGRVSNMVNAINQSANSSIRGRIPKSSSKDDLLKDQSLNNSNSNSNDALNSSSRSLLSLRNRQILRLDVPVHDSEKAGLGISVKGKVTVGPEPHDLGIFIKSVLHGGAASRDGRLHTNDQLLSVNGVSLVGQSNAEAMETLRRALLHSRPNVHGSISLTVARRTDSMDNLARWKDDTPPNGNDTTNSNENSNSQNFNTIIYNGDKENKPEYPKYEKIEERQKHATVVTVNSNGSWASNQSDDCKGYLERDDSNHDSKRDSFEWSRLDGWNPVIDRLTGLRNESYYMATQPHVPLAPSERRAHARSPPHHHVIIEEDYVTRGSAGESGSESGHGFSRDAVGRRSMSEKRHAALDARATGTYKKIKELKAEHALQVGPSLGMRKSSSLESLQTAIQEKQRNPRNEPIYARAHPPLKHWLTDDSAAPDTLVRGSPQQSSLSHKKPSLLKSLSTMFRIGKPHKKTDTEICGRSTPGRSSEKSLSREALERHSRIDERLAESSEREHNLREESRRSERSERTERLARPPERRSARTAPSHAPQALDSAWGPTGHYVNYEEIQHNLNGYSARREKLSEVQIGQMRRQVDAQRAKAEEESRRAGSGYHSQRSCRDARTQSNYYDYDTAPPRRPGKLSHYH